jgi:formate dehydrogenase subunit gamma
MSTPRPLSAARPTAPAAIRRFTGAQRLLHLVLAVTFLGMLWTGLCLWSPALAEVMNRPLAKQWHFYFAIALGIAFVLTLVLRPRDIRAFAREVDSLDRADRAWLRGGPRRLFNPVGAPAQGWLNAGQKLNTAVTIGLLVVLALTGILLWLGERNNALRFSGTIDVHDLATILIVVLVCGHLYLAVFNPATRASLRGMTTGTVDREWARMHHERWVEETEATTRDDDAASS